MPIIIAIAIIIFIFRGGVFWLFEKIFYGIIAVFDFFATLFSDISLRRYQKQSEKIRKNRLKDIDKAYNEKNYKKVISLYREVIGDCDYCNYDTMKYCHIASDAVCQVAKTIPEYEEARTWTRIISARDSKYKQETEELFSDISKRGAEILKIQDELLVAVGEAIYTEDFDKTKELLNQMADNGNIDALITLTEMSILSIDYEMNLNEAKALLDRLDAVDFHFSTELRKMFDNKPIVKYKEYDAKAKEYSSEGKKQHGMERINTYLKAIEEWEKAYKVLSSTVAIVDIARHYQMISFEYMDAFPASRHTVEKALEYLRVALTWTDLYKENGYKGVGEIIEKYRKNITESIAELEKIVNK